MNDTLKQIPVEEKLVSCRFGDSLHAVGRYSMPNGCVCYPNDQEQDLCGQHVIKAEPFSPGGMTLILIYDVSFYEMYAK